MVIIRVPLDLLTEAALAAFKFTQLETELEIKIISTYSLAHHHLASLSSEEKLSGAFMIKP